MRREIEGREDRQRDSSSQVIRPEAEWVDKTWIFGGLLVDLSKRDTKPARVKQEQVSCLG